jgi:hypothetical protein
MPLSFENGKTRSTLPLALEAVRNLTIEELNGVFISGQMAAMSAHTEILHTPINQRTGPFYRHLLPLREHLVSLLAGSYRRYFKLALAHPHQAGRFPDEWAWGQLEPVVSATLEWIRDWYILACDGENQYFQNIGSIPFVPGQKVSIPIPLTAPPFPPPEFWRAPSWLFEVAPTLGFIRPLKTEHVPAVDSEQKLDAAHTRLLLKLARRVFLWELRAAIERVRNEEIAAAGAIPTEPTQIVNSQTRKPNKRKGWEQRLKLYAAIQKTLSTHSSLEGIEFCAELDRRHAPPLYDWTKRGEWREGLTWKEAWGNPHLRKKIRRVRQEAMKRR